MTPFVLTFAVAGVLALITTPLFRLRAGAGTLRSQTPYRARAEEKPRVGGVVIFAAFAATPFVASLVSPAVADVVIPRWREISGLLAAAFLVSVLGYVDDVHELAWFQKTGGQVAAAVILYALGYRLGDVSLPGGGSFDFGVLDLPATIVWLWLVTNAINTLDGHDGVAAGVTALAAGSMALVAWDLGHVLVAILFASLAGAVSGFLPFNFPAASRFLGDSGAQLLGFLLGALAISGFVDQTGRVPLYIPAIALAVPIVDYGLAFTRRLLDGRHPFHGDMDHVHHRIERMLGYGPKRLAFAFYGFSALFSAAAVGLHLLRGTLWVGGIVAAVAGLVAAFLWRLDYHKTAFDSLAVRRIRRTVGRKDRGAQLTRPEEAPSSEPPPAPPPHRGR